MFQRKGKGSVQSSWSQDTTLFDDIKAIPLCAFFFFSTLEAVFNLEELWGIFFRDTRRNLFSTRCSNPPATSGRTIKGCWPGTPGCRARNSRKNVTWQTMHFLPRE